MSKYPIGLTVSPVEDSNPFGVQNAITTPKFNKERLLHLFICLPSLSGLEGGEFESLRTGRDRVFLHGRRERKFTTKQPARRGFATLAVSIKMDLLIGTGRILYAGKFWLDRIKQMF